MQRASRRQRDRTRAGFVGAKVVDGLQIEGTFHPHQVPLLDAEHVELLERWMQSYKPEQLFTGMEMNAVQVSDLKDPPRELPPRSPPWRHRKRRWAPPLSSPAGGSNCAYH